MTNYNSQKSDIFEISFNGDEVIEEEEILKHDSPNISYLNKSLKHRSGIHCPCCGTRMLSLNDYENLLVQASRVKDAEDFLNLLNLYKDYIPKNMKDLLLVQPYMVRVLSPENPNSNGIGEPKIFKDMRTFMYNAKNLAYHKHTHSIDNCKKYLTEYSSSLNDSDKQALLNCIDTIDKSDSNYIISQKIKPVITNIVPSSEGRFNVFKNIFPQTQATSQFCALFKGIKYKELSDSEIALEIARRLFKHSVQIISPITKLKEFQDNINNELLLCQSCNDKSSNSSFLNRYYSINPNLKHNLKTYIADLAFLMGRGEIPKNTSYMNNYMFVTGKCTYDMITFSENDKNNINNLLFIASRHGNFAPIEQTEVDIPCASCGSTLLPHSVRKEIIQELDKCKTLNDYKDLLIKYDKYIGVHSRQLASIFKSEATKDPQISQDRFMKNLQHRMNGVSQKETEKVLEKLREARLHFFETGSNDTFYWAIDTCLNRLDKYIMSGKFNDFRFYEMYNECFNDIKLESAPNAVYTALTDLRIIAYKNSLAKPSELDEISDKNPYYTIVFNIFKTSAATVDHLVPVCKEGEKHEIDNYIGLCKPCNSLLKSKKSIISWYNQVLSLRPNMLRHLEIINQMAKDGKLKGFDNWAKNIANTMYEQTYGRYDIREHFE